MGHRTYDSKEAIGKVVDVPRYGTKQDKKEDMNQNKKEDMDQNKRLYLLEDTEQDTPKDMNRDVVASD